jgi:signal transduction histidine kinase
MVDIRLSVDTKELRLEIKGDGLGKPRKRLTSLIEGAAEARVGLAGMRERMRELGGSLKSDLIEQGRHSSSAFLSRGQPLIPRMAKSGRGVSAA